jgi:uncharacterized protein (TIGR02996 family)
MSIYLNGHPQVLEMLQDAKEHPEQDGPRLVLADWLEDHGDQDRADFIRCQCLLAVAASELAEGQRRETEDRCEHLLDQHGGGWIGPLWREWCSTLAWHRGLLSVRLPRSYDPSRLAGVLPWVDTALFLLHGRTSLQRAVDLLRLGAFNHCHLDFRGQMGEQAILDVLAQSPESPCLRTLSFDWPIALLRMPEGDDEEERPLSVPAVSEEFLVALLGLPLARRLTHLGSSRPFADEQVQVIRNFGVEPAHASDRLWMHRRPPATFRSRMPLACCGPFPSAS